MGYMDNSMADEWAMRKLAYLYARALDHYEVELFDEIFTIDGTFNEQNARTSMPINAERLRDRCISTMHAVHNQTVIISGNTAEGETYGIAHHVTSGPANTAVIYDIGMRYLDTFAKVDGVWRIAARRNRRDWAETRSIRIKDEIGRMSA